MFQKSNVSVLHTFIVQTKYLPHFLPEKNQNESMMIWQVLYIVLSKVTGKQLNDRLLQEMFSRLPQRVTTS